jgi:hypothetical protein
MFLYGGLALLCLIAGFGLGMYEYELRRQIVHSVQAARPDLDTGALYAGARSWRASTVHGIYRDLFPESNVLRRHTMVSLASPACFVAFAVLLMLAIKHS